MSKIKSTLIDLYRMTTWPIRWCNLARMKRNATVPVSVLFYHRVDDRYPNPWTMRCDDFEEQIDWFQENFDLVSLEECQRRIKSGKNDRPTLSITFDDGYADNCTFALPMLIERGIPVTYFVTTDNIVKQIPFPHDVDRQQPLEPNSVEAIRALADAGIEIGGHTRTHPDLGSISDPDILFDEVITATEELGKHIGRRIRYFAFPYGQRANLNREVFRLLKENGIEGVCSAFGGMNAPGTDPFHLHRLHGDPDFSRMKNWLTFDPRIPSHDQFDYQQGGSKPSSSTNEKEKKTFIIPDVLPKTAGQLQDSITDTH